MQQPRLVPTDSQQMALENRKGKLNTVPQRLLRSDGAGVIWRSIYSKDGLKILSKNDVWLPKRALLSSAAWDQKVRGTAIQGSSQAA